MAAHEDETQLIVAQLPFEIGNVFGRDAEGGQDGGAFLAADALRRTVSIAALCATRKSQAGAFSGIPWCGQVCQARSIASCTASSASSR